MVSTLFSLWFKFSSAGFNFLSKCRKERGKTRSGKNLKLDIESYSKIESAFVDVTLFNLMAGEWGQYQFLAKTATHLPYFRLLTPPLKRSN